MNPTSPAAATQPTCSIGDGVDQAAHRLDRGDRRRQGDHRDHEQPGQVFGAAESVGVAAGGGLGAQGERDPQRDRGQRVGEVVDGVGQQRDRAGDHHDHQLRDRGGAQRQQADLHRPDTGGAGFQRAVDAVGGVVAVRGEHLPQRRADLAAPAAVAMPVVVTMAMAVPVTVAVAVRCDGSASWVMRGVPSVAAGVESAACGVQGARGRRRRGDGRARRGRRARR